MTADRSVHATVFDGFLGGLCVLKLYDPQIWVCGEITLGTEAQIQFLSPVEKYSMHAFRL